MPSSKPKISLILPIYNERENVIPLLTEIEGVLRSLGNPFEILVIDDGSRDGTTDLLFQLARSKTYLKVVQFRVNAGQTAALDAGFRHSTGEYLITMDADLQNDPNDIPKMLRLLEEGHDCVIGWRHERRDGFFLRRLPSIVANTIIRRLWRSKLHDLGCALKVFRREVVEELRLYGEMHRFIGLLMENMGARVTEYKVNHRPRVAGVSKYNLTRTFKVILDLVTLWFLKGYRTKPIYVFGGAGFLLGTASALFNVWVLYDKFALGISVHRNPLFLISIFFAVVGVQFLVMGLLAELLIRTYFESTDRPTYSIAKTEGFSVRRPVLNTNQLPALSV
jgi:glycosyltransferase involved in cell wall biosynthesis